MTVVVISSSGEGDRPVESLEVKAPGGRALPGQIRPGGRAIWQAVAIANQEAPKYVPREKRIAGFPGAPSRSDLGEGPCRRRKGLVACVSELPGVIEGGMSERNEQLKPGTTRGSPRRSRTAKASRISPVGAGQEPRHHDGLTRISRDLQSTC